MKAQGWAVVGPDGRIRSWSIREFEHVAKDDFADGLAPWDALAAEGYRCIPVTIEWRE